MPRYRDEMRMRRRPSWDDEEDEEEAGKPMKGVLTGLSLEFAGHWGFCTHQVDGGGIESREPGFQFGVPPVEALRACNKCGMECIGANIWAALSAACTFAQNATNVGHLLP